MKESGLYIHVPFCEHKCIYCDFYSIITTGKVRDYIDALKREITYYQPLYSESRFFSSIFFGGGTPSILAPDLIAEIIGALYQSYTISGDAEITMETNPGTVDESKLRAFKLAGINRVSVGIQSFNDADLKFLTRVHDSQTAINTIHTLRECGFENINLDLIFNLPGQTLEAWTKNLEEAVKLPVQHISAYSLILERGTILYKMQVEKKVVISDDDFDAELYRETISFLSDNGFEQYEVSNFAKPGYQCRHNNHYWQYRDYLSFGTSAHSFMNGKRWWNNSALTFYLRSMKNTGHARSGEEIITPDEMHDEYIMLALRNSGIDTNDYISKFGSGWLIAKQPEFDKLLSAGFMKNTEGRLQMTASGYAVCDEIIKRLL